MKKVLIASLMALTCASSAFAATDGAVGTSSTATAAISVTIPKLIRVRGTVDHAFGTYSGSGNLTANEMVNVSMNYGDSSRKYSITGSGSGGGGAFTVSDGGLLTLAYTVGYVASAATSGHASMTAGTALTGRGGGVKPLSDTTDNGNYLITFSSTDLQAADAASYTGTLSLLVAPE